MKNLNKKGIVFSLDVIFASLILTYFLISISETTTNFNINNKLATNEAENLLLLITDEIETMNLTLINNTLNFLKESAYDYSLNITYYDKNLNALNSSTLGTPFNSLPNTLAVHNKIGAIRSQGNITIYYYAQLRVWTKSMEES